MNRQSREFSRAPLFSCKILPRETCRIVKYPPDQQRAVTLARKACDLTNWKNADYFLLYTATGKVKEATGSPVMPLAEI